MSDDIQPGSADGESPWNPEQTLQRMGDDEQLLFNMIGYFREDAPDLLRKLATSLQQDDLSEAVRFAHSLKGLCANYDAALAVDTAHRIEECCALGDQSGATRQLPTLESRITELNAALRLWQDAHPV